MKKIILFNILFIAFSFSSSAQKTQEERVLAQVNTYIENVEKNITWTKEEKEKYTEAKKAQVIEYRKIWSEFRDKPELKKEKQKEANKTFQKTLIDAFGKKRAFELIKAGNKKD